MRFLNLHLKSPDIENLKIEFTEGLNVLSVSDSRLFTFFKKIPFFGIFGSDQDGNSFMPEDVPYSVYITAATSEGEICLINDRGEFSIKEDRGKAEGPGENYAVKKNGGLKGDFTIRDFILTSLFDPELIEKRHDPVFEKESLKSFLINKETVKYDSSFFSGRDNLLKEKEKELTDLNREKQLLELKKMKREKLQKEVQLSEREIKKLERKRESILKYKSVLNDIKLKTEEKNRLSLKINNTKKNLVELREIQEKSDSMAEKLSGRFPYFFDKGFDQLPDLNLIQESFNKYRDLNEKIDIFFIKKKRFTAILIKIVQAMAIFSLISALSIVLKPQIFPVLGIISGSSAVFALFIFAAYYFKVREYRPLQLIEQKEEMVANLIEILKKNHFAFDDCRTGEIYELLFQYFNNFISYRDINTELAELKKKIPDSSTVNDREKKLNNLIHSYEEIDEQIKTMMECLDESIYIRPEPGDLTGTMRDIEELLADNGKEINQKKELIVKFEAEIAEYDKIENSSLSIENALAEIIKKIDECRNVLDHINFLVKVLEKASEAWASQKIEKLCNISAGNFTKLTGGAFPENEIMDKIKNVILNPALVNNEQNGFLNSFVLSVKTALSGLLQDGDMPPFFIINPFSEENEFADNLKKLLLELFPERQVILIVHGSDVKFEGNMINI